MLRKFSSILFAGCLVLGYGCCAKTSSVPFKQVWRTEKPFTLTCGDYSITTGKSFNGKVAGLAFAGRELWTTAGSTQLGTLYEAPFPKEKFAQYTITVNGEVPAFVDGDIVGRKIEIRRSSDYGDLKLFAHYTLTPEGLTWSVRYKIVSEKHKAKYFYLFTMPWSKKFTEYTYRKKDVQKSGKLLNKKSWLICDELDTLWLYAPELNVAAVTEVVGNIPTESRRHTLWDLPHFHKYFLFHARPEWKVGYESPTYTLKIRAFNASKNDFITKSNIK